MYGLIGKMNAAPGRRNDLISILLQASTSMPGCISYIVAEDPEDEDGIWITEVWTDRESHKASLELASVRKAIERARPMITGFGPSFETRPIGGAGMERGT